MERFVIKCIDPAELSEAREAAFDVLCSCVDKECISEVGSTAIPGAFGKGDVDFLVLVPQDHFNEVRRKLDKKLPRNPQQLSSDVYQGYTIPARIDIAVQLTVRDGPHDDFHDFVTALRNSPELVESYNSLKRQWDGRAMDEYHEANQPFSESVLSGILDT